jgi:hypothetical protein
MLCPITEKLFLLALKLVTKYIPSQRHEYHTPYPSVPTRLNIRVNNFHHSLLFVPILGSHHISSFLDQASIPFLYIHPLRTNSHHFRQILMPETRQCLHLEICYFVQCIDIVVFDTLVLVFIMNMIIFYTKCCVIALTIPKSFYFSPPGLSQDFPHKLGIQYHWGGFR